MIQMEIKNLKSEILKLKIISWIMMINLKKMNISQTFTPCWKCTIFKQVYLIYNDVSDDKPYTVYVYT